MERRIASREGKYDLLKKELNFFFFFCLVKRHIPWTYYVLVKCLIIKNNLSDKTTASVGVIMWNFLQTV